MSRPADVVFAGFRSNTFALQQAGWKLSMNQDYIRNRLQLAMHHDGARLYLLAEDVHCDIIGAYSGMRHQMMDIQPEFHIVKASSNVTTMTTMDFSQFSPIDATPQFVETKPKNIKDFKIFASPLVRTEEILIEPQSVAECLELIRKMQAPELAAIRKRNMERDEPINQQKFHAQILSIAA